MLEQSNTIFKYFSNKVHLERFLRNGEVFFNSLSYFLSCEDSTRRDFTEDANVYMPSNGLEITITATNQKFKDHRGLISRVKRPDRIFVFCTSLELNENLFKKFGAAGCVEISDVQEFSQRLRKAIHKRMQLGTIKNGTLLFGKVDYYNHKNEPDARHACPDEIIMSKLEIPFFTAEKEYRFAFAKDKNAFDVNNVDYFLTSQIKPCTGKHPHQTLTLGNLSNICKMVM